MDTQTIHCTVDDAARVIGRHQRTVQRKIRDGKLQAIEGENGKRLVALQVPRITSREAMAAIETLRLAITQGDDEAERIRTHALIRELQERATARHDMWQEAKREVVKLKKQMEAQSAAHDKARKADEESHKKALDAAKRKISDLTDRLNSVVRNKAELENWYERGERAFHKVASERESLKIECHALRREIAEYWHECESEQAKFIETRWPAIAPAMTSGEIDAGIAELFPTPKRSTPDELAARLQAIRRGGPRAGIKGGG